MLLTVGCLGLLSLQLAAAPATKKNAKPAAKPATAKVPKSFVAPVRVVLSGDTFQVNFNGRRVIVQFDAVDAPERGQPHAEAARNSLAAKIQGKVVRIEPVRGDFDGGFIARIWLDKRSVNKQMVADGLAWHVPDVASKALDKAEARAKETRAGLWRGDSPLPPWEYRAKQIADAVANGETVGEGEIDGETRVKPLPLAKNRRRTKAGGAVEAEVREAAEKFLAAAKKGDKAKIKEVLTAKARQSFDSQPFALEQGANSSYAIDQVVVDSQLAQVAVRFEAEGTSDNAHLHLRREEGKWRVFGLQIAARGNEQALAVNFEQPGAALDDLSDGAAEVALASAGDNSAPVRLDSDTRKRLEKRGMLEKLDSRVEQLVTEYRRSLEEFAVVIRSARDEDTLQALFDSPQNPATRFAPQFLEIARGAPKSTACFQACTIVCEMMLYDRSRKGPEHLAEARDLLASNHVKAEELLLPVLFLLFSPHEANTPFFERVLADSPHKDVQGFACLAVATTLVATEKEGPDAYADAAEMIRQAQERRQRDDRIVAMLERTTSEFGKVELGDTTLGKVAEPLLFERKFLVVGKVAPEIIGKDIDGKPLKLSDFRGKVVILDFWADWCPYCAQMYPHERVMLQKFADKPFAIVGVNSDTRERYQQVLAQKKVTWPSFFDGPDGPIRERWNVSSIPEIYVLNADGVICYKELRGESLERAVERLLRNPKATPGVPVEKPAPPATPGSPAAPATPGAAPPTPGAAPSPSTATPSPPGATPPPPPQPPAANPAVPGDTTGAALHSVKANLRVPDEGRDRVLSAFVPEFPHCETRELMWQLPRAFDANECLLNRRILSIFSLTLFVGRHTLRR
ncbi:MAG: redoxin domain-containing protein [Pirellulales bacterium]|nr:redoxin domain-containing protein [Pirellulales bacterium]